VKIWIDLTNSPHVNFFAGMIRELQRDHEVLLTCRPLANTIELLDLFSFPYHVVGKHYGQSSIKKSLGFFIRLRQLYVFLRDKGVDVAISHSSFYSPVVARLLGVRSIYLNDNEHAAGNLISFRFANIIMVPEFLDRGKVRRQGAKSEKIVSYPGVKEGVYLWQYGIEGVKKIENDGADRTGTVFVRPEPWTAQYYKGELNFMDNLLIGLKDKFSVVLLPRGKVQEDYYRQARFAGVVVPETSISLTDIMARCDLFIGAGGTMTREAAVLGIPTISIYQDELLDVDRFLIEKGFMVHEPNLDAAFVIRFLERIGRRPPDRDLLRKGREAYDLIKCTLLVSGTEKKRSCHGG
jgi:predicted glycosyltransferase